MWLWVGTHPDDDTRGSLIVRREKRSGGERRASEHKAWRIRQICDNIDVRYIVQGTSSRFDEQTVAGDMVEGTMVLRRLTVIELSRPLCQPHFAHILRL